MIFIKSEIDKKIGEAIHYPRCWDTMVYPTLATALFEMVDLRYSYCTSCRERQERK